MRSAGSPNLTAGEGRFIPAPSVAWAVRVPGPLARFVTSHARVCGRPVKTAGVATAGHPPPASQTYLRALLEVGFHASGPGEQTMINLRRGGSVRVHSSGCAAAAAAARAAAAAAVVPHAVCDGCHLSRRMIPRIPCAARAPLLSAAPAGLVQRSVAQFSSDRLKSARPSCSQRIPTLTPTGLR